jgi:hypothetical protein
MKEGACGARHVAKLPAQCMARTTNVRLRSFFGKP